MATSCTPRHPLVLLLLGLTGCCVASRRAALSLSRCAALSSSRRASWLSHHNLLSSSRCTALLSSHRVGWLLCCLFLCCPLVVLSCRPSSPHHRLAVSSLSPTPSNTIKHCCHHQTPPPLPPLNAVSIVHCCHSCCPLPPSKPNAHLRPLPPSNADARCRHPPPLMSISIVASPSPICSPHCHHS